MRAATILPLLLALASCTSTEIGTSLDARAGSGSLAYPLLEGSRDAASPLSAAERPGSLSTLRRTVLRNDGFLPGENFVTVETRGAQGAKPTLLRPPSVEMLREEMRRALPGLSMRISNTVAQGSGGPFGFATGSSSSGGSCVYAWRWRDRASAGLLARRDPVSIRIRLCGSAPSETLLRSVMALDPETDAGTAAGLFIGGSNDALGSASQSLGVATPSAVAEEAEEPRPIRGHSRPSAQHLPQAPAAEATTQAEDSPKIPAPAAAAEPRRVPGVESENPDISAGGKSGLPAIPDPVAAGSLAPSSGA